MDIQMAHDCDQWADEFLYAATEFEVNYEWFD